MYHSKMGHTYLVAKGESSIVNEILKGKLYFATILSKIPPCSTSSLYFFSTDEELVYSNFYNDFGPLNLGNLYRYCCHVNSKIKDADGTKTKLVHYTTTNPRKRVNAAFLIGSYSIIYLNKSPKQVYKSLTDGEFMPFVRFQDASMGAPIHTIELMDCFCGIYRALQHELFNFDDFDLSEYDRTGMITHGDMNWIIPEKMLAFCGPTRESNTPYKPPEFYVEYFQKNNVETVIRLNKRNYNEACFIQNGIKHFELYFPDGTTPTMKILYDFLQICESTKGAVAVHCKAGLGRTGSLIGAYVIKHYQMTAREAIAWLRICRPGSVIGKQQVWLEENEEMLKKLGDKYRFHMYGHKSCYPKHKYGIYSNSTKLPEQIRSKRNAIKKSNPELKHPSKKKLSNKVTEREHERKKENLSLQKFVREIEKVRMLNISPKYFHELSKTLYPDDIHCRRNHAKDLLHYDKGSNANEIEIGITQGDRLNMIKMLQIRYKDVRKKNFKGEGDPVV